MIDTLTDSTATSPARAGWREWAALPVLVLAVVLLAIDATVLSLAVPALSRDLAPTATELLWIGDVYSFALAGLLVTMGTLADRIGRKRMLLMGAVAFGAASVFAAFAPTAGMLILARALLGVAAATLMPSTLSLIRQMFRDPTQRRTAIAIWSAGASAGAALGPIVGGALLERFSWGSVFLINVPVMIVMVVAGAFLLRESRDPRPGRLDVLSAALSIVAVVGVVFAIKELATHGVSWLAAAVVVVGVIAGVVVVRRQRTLAGPLIDLELFRNRAFSGSVLADLIGVLGFSGMIFFLSQYFQLVRGYGPLEAGLRELPAALASVVVVVIVSRVVGRLGMGRAIATGLLVGAAGLVLLAVAEGADSYLWLAGALALVGLGVGLAVTLTTDAVVSAVPPRKAGAASAVSETAYELGVALGIALLGSLQVVVYRLVLDVPSSVSPQTAAAVRESLASATAAIGGSDAPQAVEVLQHAQHAFTIGMQTTAVIAAVIMSVAAIVAWRVIPSGRVDHSARRR